jgi:polyphosphate kinase
VLRRDLLPALARAGITVVEYCDLTAVERADVDQRFVDAILPLITPLVCHNGVPLADAPGLGLNLAVELDAGRLGIVRIPEQLSTLVPLTESRQPARETFVWLHQVIAANLHRVFPRARIQSAHPFRIMRDADIVLEAATADELPQRTIAAVRQRETNPVLMMVVPRRAPARLVERLAQVL